MRRSQKVFDDPFDWPVKRSIQNLRRSEFIGDIVNNKPVSNGIWFEWDGDRGDIKGKFYSPKDELLEAEFHVRRPGRWLTLNLALSAKPLIKDRGILFVCRLSSTNSFSVTPIIRTGHMEYFSDTQMNDSFLVTAVPQIHTAILYPHADSSLLQPHRSKKLMLNLPQVTGKLFIQDLCCLYVDKDNNSAK